MEIYPDLQETIKKAIILSNEHFWKYQDALVVIEKLSINNFAVVGVELYEKEDNQPKWIASSNYDFNEKMPWDEYINLCKKSAIEFVELNKNYSPGLFNLAFISNNEFCEFEKIKEENKKKYEKKTGVVTRFFKKISGKNKQKLK